jgi:putative transposase
MIESFNGRLRVGCLNEHWFLSLGDAERKIEVPRRHYYESRSYSALGWVIPTSIGESKGAANFYF